MASIGNKPLRCDVRNTALELLKVLIASNQSEAIEVCNLQGITAQEGLVKASFGFAEEFERQALDR